MQHAHTTPTLGNLAVLPQSLLFNVLRCLSIRELRGNNGTVYLCRELCILTNSALALPSVLDLRFLARGKKQAISPLFAVLAKLKTTETSLLSLKIGNYKFGKTSFKKLLKSCPNIAGLDCGTSKIVSADTFSNFAATDTPNLRSFKMGWCYDVPEQQFLRFASGRANLECLQLSNVEGLMGTWGAHQGHPSLTDTFLSLLSHDCPKLRSLSISGAIAFSDDGVAGLSSGCPSLQSLTLIVSCTFGQPDLHGTITSKTTRLLQGRANPMAIVLQGWPHIST
jgi:hypothetical protein